MLRFFLVFFNVDIWIIFICWLSVVSLVHSCRKLCWAKMQLTRTIRKVALTDSFQNLPQGKAVRRISLLAPVPSLKPPGQLPQVWVGTFVSELHPSPGSLETQAFLHRHNWYIASAAEALKSRSVKEYKTLEMKAKYFKEKGGGVCVCTWLCISFQILCIRVGVLPL